MEEAEDLIKVGKYNCKFNEILGIDIETLDIYIDLKGCPHIW